MRVMVKPEVRNNAMTSVLIKPLFFLAPIITDFIRNTSREIYDEEDALEMLDLESSKDDDNKTHCNQLNASPLHRGNASTKNGPARENGGCSGKHLPNRWLMTLCFCPAGTRSVCRNWHKLVSRSRDTERRVCQNPSRVATLGRTPW